MLFSLFCSVVKNGKLESVIFYHEFHCISLFIAFIHWFGKTVLSEKSFE